MKHIQASLAALAIVLAAWATVAAETRLADDFEGASTAKWTFTNGAEFPGARGSFDRAKDAAHAGDGGGRLKFDFTGGGAYVGAILQLDKAPDIAAVRLWIKKPDGHPVTFRYTDQTGQTLQKSFFALDDAWCDVLIGVDSWTGHWGGANDGVVHGAPKSLAFLVGQGGGASGEVLLDDVRLIEGKPGTGAGMQTAEYTAMRFEEAEGWSLRTTGNAGASKLTGKKLAFDFTRGASAVGLGPRDRSLLGTPQEFRISVRGKAPGHPVRLRLATHFMTFEKVLGEFTNDGENELVVKAPPGEGWTWFNGENDGKIHGPLRLVSIHLDHGTAADAGELELIDIRVKATFPPQRACIVLPELRDDAGGKRFVAVVRSASDKPIAGSLTWTIRDWDGKVVRQEKQPLTVPAGGIPAEASVAMPEGTWPFLEAEAALEAADQMTPPAQAYYIAPIEPSTDAALDPRSPFGMGLYLDRYGGDPAGLKLMDQAARLGQEAGVKWSREGLSWGRLEPRRGQYDWRYYDNLVATAKRHGISIYGIISYWAGWTKPYTPEGIEDYCRFAAAAAEHYRADIQHWEVWNEPNIFFWQGPRDMYAELLKQAHAAIKKANPDAKVLGCSTAGIDSKFIQRTMDLGGPFDILTIHPYRSVLDDRAFIGDLRKVAGLVKRPDGSAREVWITEMGWATHVPHNSMQQDFAPNTQRRQAEMIARAYIDAVASGVSPNISWYDFRNDGEDPINFEHNMGIVTRDFRPKPAYRAFATVTRMLKGLRPEKDLDLGPDVVGYRFVDAAGQRAVIALWTPSAAREVSLPAPAGATLVDLMGTSHPLTAADGKVTIPLAPGRAVFVAMP